MNPELVAIISLAALAFAIYLGFTKNVNTGITAIALALIIGRLGGMADAAIIKGFPTTTFVRVMGPMIFFSIAGNNKTVEYLAKKTVAHLKLSVKLMPLALFLISGLICMVGPGTIATPAIMTVVAASLAVTMGVDPLIFAIFGCAGACAFGMSPFTSAGIIGINLAETAGIELAPWRYWFASSIGGICTFMVLYFFLGCHKLKSNVQLNAADMGVMNKEQKQTMICMVAMIIAVMFFKVDVGLACFVVSAIMLVLGADQKAAISNVPWRTLIMFSGFAILMNVVMEVGGVDVMSNGLAAIMTHNTANGFMTLSAGILSLFSTATAVVMPTLIPTIPAVCESMGANISISAMIAGVSAGAFSSTMSPFSLGGSFIQGACTQAKDPTSEELRKMWRKQLIAAFISMAVTSLVSLSGILNIIV